MSMVPQSILERRFPLRRLKLTSFFRRGSRSRMSKGWPREKDANDTLPPYTLSSQTDPTRALETCGVRLTWRAIVYWDVSTFGLYRVNPVISPVSSSTIIAMAPATLPSSARRPLMSPSTPTVVGFTLSS